ncbi:ABC transporter permease [Nonomuraea sp. NPDC049158]|uniref:ABC transporter permease n=1 Tax=Nonomuraea sp. NPDC049158 TaxID=3155649 RepID=UPI0033C76448
MTRLGAESAAFRAAVRKEWQVMARYKSNLVTLAGAAVVVPAGYYAQAVGYSGASRQALDVFASRSGTTQIAGFIYLGWAIYLWISQMMWGPGSALRTERMQGSLEMVYLSPVSRFTILFGPATAQLIPAGLLFTVVGLMLRFAFGVPIGPQQLLAGLVVVLASIPALFALGALMSVITLRFRDAEGVVEAVRGALGLVCGVTYPIAVLPDWIQPISRALPPTQILEVLREQVLRPAWAAGTGTRLVYLLGVGVAMSVLATISLSWALRSAHRTGRLGQY